MKNVSTLTISFSIIIFALLSLTIDIAHPDTVSPLRPTDDILRSKAAFALVNEAIARGLNLHTLSESDYCKLRGPVLLEPQTYIHYQLREEFDRIVNTVDFGASSNTGSANQSPSINRGDKPILHRKAAEIIRDFIAQKHISVIIMSDAPIGIGEIAAIRGLQGEVRYTYESINGASVSVPLQNTAALIKQPFITEIWPNSKGSSKLSDSVTDIGADNVHNAPINVPPGLGVTGKGVTVAVVDTGIDSDHPELQGRIKDTRGHFQINDETHGTFIAGIIGAADNNNQITGVAPDVDFLDATYGTISGTIEDRIGNLWNDERTSYDEVKDAMKWAIEKEADIIIMCLGWDPWLYGREGTDSMSKIIDDAIENGIVFVVSAGNEAKQRASGTLRMNVSDNLHKFIVPNNETFAVTLVQDAGEPDLDLVILDWEGNVFCESHTGDEGIWSFDTYLNIDLNPWRGTVVGESVDGMYQYKQVKCGAREAEDYTAKVRRNNGNQANVDQTYELWLEKGGIFEPYNPEDTIAVPGYNKKVITVGNLAATVKSSTGKSVINDIEKTSSQGSNIPNQPLKPEVVAPGTQIESIVDADDGKKRGTGTSYAAPHVAGVAALILDAVGKNDAGKWNFSPEEVKSAIVRGAIGDIGKIPDTPNHIYGAGLVKADNIIFGGTVKAGQKLLFKITPRLTESSFSSGYLNAKKGLAVAISSEQDVSNLDWKILHRDRKFLVVEELHGASNYKKITVSSYRGSISPGESIYLNISHNGTGNSISFTGASTHPLEKINAKLDVNGDGVVDVKDLAEVADVLVAAKKLTVSHTDSHYDVDKDVDGDNDVDLDDMLAIANEISEAAAAPSAHLTEIETIQHWLAEAKRMGNIDPDFLQTIEMLERLLDLLPPIIPMETALLANYPNPFNPDTWIPYQLAKPADVTFTIHAVDGSLVRALDLGHQRAGIYQSRTRAAHWDGRNTQGEPVASGVYFYTFKAGDFTATRKMLIRK